MPTAAAAWAVAFSVTPGRPALAAAAAAESGDSQGLEEIVVTATRRAESLGRVPMSVAAYSEEALEQRGVRSIDDIAALTPGIQFNRTGVGEQSTIAVRGIASIVGAATTGVYIDDTPIQVRTMGFFSTNPYPAVFDLERVEVLRGPQGTLFGAGAEGGAVRFITPALNFTKDSAYYRTEIASTDQGDISYEVGGAKGGPISDSVAYRASVYYRRDGGFIDRVPYPAAAGPDAPETNTNWFSTIVLHGQLGWAPTDRLTITASVFGQERHINNASNYWLSTPDGPLSDPTHHRYISGNGEPDTANDNFVLPTLSIKYRFDFADLTATSSYLSRSVPSGYDYRQFMNAAFGGGANPLPVFSTPGYFDHGDIKEHNENWSQEVRLQSADATSAFQWIGGIFVQTARQTSAEYLDTPFFDITTGIPNASELFFGSPLVDGKYVYIDYNRTNDKQFAGFGELSYTIAGQLKLQAGVRVARSEVDFAAVRAAPGAGFGSDTGSERETPVTPRFSVSEQINPDNMVYATVAKGYRSGGSNRALPDNPQCNENLQSIGLQKAPLTYKSDRTWSYEIGSKNSLFGNRLRLASSLYYIKWDDIINQVALSTCALQFITNLGSATSKGFDLQADAQIIDPLSVSGSVGYTKATYDKTIQAAGATTPIVREGWSLGNAPWVMTLSTRYQFKNLFGVPGYLRADWTYRTRNDLPQASTDPTSSSYNPGILVDPAQQNLDLRLGCILREWDLSAFVSNVMNEHYELSVTNQSFGGRIFQATAVRPRTIGITLSGRF